MTEDELFEDVKYWKGRADALVEALKIIEAKAYSGDWTLPSSFGGFARVTLNNFYGHQQGE